MPEIRDGFVGSPLRTAASLRPHSTALIDADGRAVSYEEFAELTSRAASFCTAAGFEAGDIVATLLPRTPVHLALLWGLWHIGAVAAPVSHRLPADVVRERLHNLGARGIVTENPDEARYGDGVVAVSASSISQEEARYPLSSLELSAPCTLIYTSGSTGRPRAALHAFENHYQSALASNQNIPVQPGDRWLLSLPLHHVGGLAILFRCAIGGAAVQLQSRDQKTVDLAQEVTHLSLVPTQLMRLFRRSTHPPEGLKAVLLGGGPIPDDLVEEAVAHRWPLHTSYGLTEMSSQVATTSPGASLSDLKTAGYPLPSIDMRIDYEGEIAVRGSTRFLGYLSDGSLEEPFDDDGWFATGDLGRLDAAGRLVVSGRKDAMIISGGENIQPAEIEEVLLASDFVDEAAVVGVPDEEFGQRPVAFVRWCSLERDVDMLRAFARQRLPDFKVPSQILDFPPEMGRGMKPKREALSSWAREHI